MVLAQIIGCRHSRGMLVMFTQTTSLISSTCINLNGVLGMFMFMSMCLECSGKILHEFLHACKTLQLQTET